MDPESLYLLQMCATGLVVFVLIFGGNWLMCWVMAVPCIKCGSKADTECIGEYGQKKEYWRCHKCGITWDTHFAVGD